MSVGCLVGLTAAAAHAVAEARGNPVALEQARAALERAFANLNPQEANELGAAAGALLEQHARATGEWAPWSEIWWYARLPALRDAASSFRSRLDESARGHEVQERRQIAARAESAIRRAIRPLIAARLSLAEIEEAAGTAAGEAMEWDNIFPIIQDEIARVRGRISENAR